MYDYQSKAHRYCVFQHRTFKHVAALRPYFSSKHGKEKVHRPTKPRKAQIRPQEARFGRFPPQVGNGPAPAWTEAGLGHTGASLAEVTGEAEKPFFVFCFSQAGNKRHRSLKPTHSSLLGRASRAPARRCRSAQKAGRSRLPARSARGGPHRGPSPLTHFAKRRKTFGKHQETY